MPVIQKAKGACGCEKEPVPDWSLISSAVGNLMRSSPTRSWDYVMQLQEVLIFWILCHPQQVSEIVLEKGKTLGHFHYAAQRTEILMTLV